MSDTTQLADYALLQSALDSKPVIDVSKGKSVAVVYDGNQGSYNSGLITIDATSQLTGSRGFGSLKDAYITLPYVITGKSTGSADMASGLSRFACGLKCNVTNVIDSLTVELNGKKVVTETEYKGFWNNVRAMTELSQDEVVKHGADSLLYPDKWYSINNTVAASAAGDGYSNNQVVPSTGLDATLSQTQEPLAFNEGFFKRIIQGNPPIVDATETTAASSWISMGTTACKNICQQNGKGAFKETGTSNLASGGSKIVGTWHYMLKIRLADLHPIFKELDLISNPQLKLRMRINTGVVAISGNASSMKLDSVTMTSGQTCPIMVTSAGTGSPMNDILTVANSQLSFAFGAVGNAFTPTSAVGEFYPYSTARLHIPFLQLKNATALIQKPIKTVRYQDCFAQYFKNVAGTTPASPTAQLNAPFNLQVSGYQKNVKYIAVLPFADTRAAHFASAHGTEQFQSPFDSAPWTQMPGASIRNFQVQIGNQNVFASSQEYDYESFQDEFCKLSSINGDLSHELSNGLIDSAQWAMANRILVADCSRLTSKDVPQAIQVSGINGSATGMNLLVLVVYERELEIDRLTGEVHRSD